MRYGSVCSGIEAATCAWHPLGWRAAFVSEIEPFPRAVLKHRWPEIPLHGDFTTIQAGDYEPIDVLVGGTPCQSFSVAGLRGGLADDRGNLALEYLKLADRLRPRWLVWENVPGVLSSNGGRDFGAILGGMVELGYGFAYRVLDAQFFGVAQRRRRLFVVGRAGDWRRAAAVLFERHSLSGNPPPRREARQEPTRGAAFGISPDCFDRSGEGAGGTPGERSGDHEGREGLLVSHALRAEGFDASEDGTGRGTPIIPVAYRTSGNCGAWETGDKTDALTTSTDPNSHVLAFSCKDHGADAGDIAPTLRGMGHDKSHANASGQLAVAFTQNSRSEVREIGGDGSLVGALAADAGAQQQSYVLTLAIRGPGDGHNLESRDDGTANAILTPNGGRAGIGVGAIATHSAVRRLTPRECERLQGFPDDYTLIPWRNGLASDGPRYKALGNSMAVPVMRWIGERIAAVEALAERVAA